MNVREIVARAQAPDERSVSRQVQHLMLSAIADGHLVAGDSVQDQEWASAMGISRTPVREASQCLQGMGLLDVAAARYTRLRTFTPKQAADEAQDWALLHHALTHSIVERLPDGLVDQLSRIHDALIRRGCAGDAGAQNFRFFHALREAAPQSAVTLGATAAAYRVRLAEPVLPDASDAHAILREATIDALTHRNGDRVRWALGHWMPTYALAS